MTEIIFERPLKCNNDESHSSDVSLHPANMPRITRLPRLAFSLLKILYDDHMDGVKTERTLEELSRRFRRDVATISRAFTFLGSLGFSEVKKMGQSVAQRCITLCGFSWLDNQTSSLTSSLNHHIPYLYLSKREEKNLLNNKEAEICGELDQNINSVDQELDPHTLIDSLPIAKSHKERLSDRFNRTRIGATRLHSLMARFLKAQKKNPIKSILGYLTKSLDNEERQVWQLKHLFFSKGMRWNQYAQ